MNYDEYSYGSAREHISERLYNGVIGGTLFWGFLVNIILVSQVNTAFLYAINPWVFIVGYFASCFLGIHIVHASQEAVLKFVGYNFIVVPFGLILNLFISQFDPDIVLIAMLVTGFVTLSMMALGMLFPAIFAKMGRVLFLSLFMTIIAQLIMLLIGFRTGIIDWIVAIIFCGYIGYDWAVANSKERTVGNAVESAASIYIDIINLFIRILAILGKKK